LGCDSAELLSACGQSIPPRPLNPGGCTASDGPVAFTVLKQSAYIIFPIVAAITLLVGAVLAVKRQTVSYKTS